MNRLLCAFSVCVIALSWLAAAQETPYVQEEDHVYATIDGVDFYMDIFTPKERDPEKPGHGLAIVDVASGAWHADRGKINDHKKAQFFDVFTKHGYIVFAVRPGTRGAYDATEMVDHLHQAIRYIKAHAETYGFDPDRLGITGPSAGGHLASLVALGPRSGDPASEDPLARIDTAVKAAGVFFPPTDFLDWNGGTRSYLRLGELFWKEGVEGKSDEAIRERAMLLSPRHQVKGKTVPFLIFHGDADPLVPLQQSEVLVEALKAHDNDVTFVIVPGGAHPWPTIYEEVEQMAQWFNKVLTATE